jgi:hypothetical protein
MSTIVAGRFEQQSQAQLALAALKEAGFPADEMTSFFVNPAGQHSLYEVGGDEDTSPGSEDSVSGAVAGTTVGGAIGLAVGLATLPFLGPAAVIVGAGAGAYAGSLMGALETMHKDGPGTGTATDPIHPRHSGILIGVVARTPEEQAHATEVLRKLGAFEMELAQGTIANGEWDDFDPRKSVTLLGGTEESGVDSTGGTNSTESRPPTAASAGS